MSLERQLKRRFWRKPICSRKCFRETQTFSNKKKTQVCVFQCTNLGQVSS
jgi:hypothetical protein